MGTEKIIPREIWEKRAELLRKAREGKLTFDEFNLMDMHEETRKLLGKNNNLSGEGLATLSSIEIYLKNEGGTSG